MSKISVIIPLYNKALYIKRAIDSVLSQTYQDLELIVVDDGSTDGGGDIVKQYADPRIRYIYQTNTGECAARNTGIKAAITELTAFLDADDAYYPGFLAEIIKLQDSYPTAGMFAAAYCYVNSNGQTVPPRFKALPLFPWKGIIPDYFQCAAMGEPPVCSSAVAIKRTVFETAGYFPAGEKNGGDRDTWFRIALHYPIAFSSYIGACYFRDAQNRVSSSTSTLGRRPMIETAKTALKNNLVPSKSIVFVKAIIDRKLISDAKYHALAGNRLTALSLLLKTRTAFFAAEKLKIFSAALLPHFIIRRIAGRNNA